MALIIVSFKSAAKTIVIRLLVPAAGYQIKVSEWFVILFLYSHYSSYK